MGISHEDLRKLHTFTGLVPLGAYLGFHAWELWPVHAGRGPALERLEASSAPVAEILFVLLPLFGHAILGLRLRRTVDSSAAYASPAFRRFQAITGGLTAAFLGWHVASVWLPHVLAGQAADAYVALLEQVGQLPGAALYVLGTASVCVHFGQGLSAAWIRFRPEASPSFVRAVGVAVGVALWLVFFDTLAVYATGAGLM